MNRVYPSAKDHLWAGEIDITSDDLRVQLVDDTAVFDDDDEVLGDLGAVTVGSAVSIGAVVSSGGELGDASPVTITDAPGATDVGAFVIYVESGSALTRYLIAWVDTASDSSPVGFTTDGDDVIVNLADPFIRL